MKNIKKIANQIFISRILSSDQKNEMQEIEKILKVQRAGKKRQDALERLISLAEQVYGRKPRSVNEAYQMLDWKEPKIR